jgi:2-amino-4-hydroxy-6-hydroxymethyldihydropteridine diphosphokinase
VQSARPLKTYCSWHGTSNVVTLADMTESSSFIETGFSLGSNLGDRRAHLSEAKRRMLAVPDVRLVAQSPAYETAPVDVQAEYRGMKFLNAVLVVASPLHARDWLEQLDRIEHALGRVRGPDRNAPRPIDIDILYSGDECIDSGGLTVPHPRWATRRFVVQPLADVRPSLVLPGSGFTVAEVLATLSAASDVTLLPEDW